MSSCYIPIDAEFHADFKNVQLCKGEGGGKNVLALSASHNAFSKTLLVIGQFSKRYCVMKNVDVMRFCYDPKTSWRYWSILLSVIALSVLFPALLRYSVNVIGALRTALWRYEGPPAAPPFHQWNFVFS